MNIIKTALKAHETEYADTVLQLMPRAMEIADLVCRRINETVPVSIPTMPYARQWVLEETIKLLQAQV